MQIFDDQGRKPLKVTDVSVLIKAISGAHPGARKIIFISTIGNTVVGGEDGSIDLSKASVQGHVRITWTFDQVSLPDCKFYTTWSDALWVKLHDDEPKRPTYPQSWYALAEPFVSTDRKSLSCINSNLKGTAYTYTAMWLDGQVPVYVDPKIRNY